METVRRLGLRALLEGCGLVAVSAVAAAGMWLATGGPDRRVPCDGSALEPGQVCLAEVLETGGEILWADARPRALWKRNGMEGAVLLTDDAAEDFDELLAACFEQVAGADRVVVYCGQAGCGSSEAVAARLRETGLAREVLVLYGGWKALHAAGLTGSK